MATVGDEFATPDRATFFEVNRTRLRAWCWGDPMAPPVVLVHGAYDHGRTWDDFAPRLVELMAWTEAEFLERTAGSAIRRIGHLRWLRNVAIALGNAPPSAATVAALESRRDHPSEVVRESVAWALARRRERTV